MGSNFDYKTWRVEKQLQVKETYMINASSQEEALETANESDPTVIETILNSVDARLASSLVQNLPKSFGNLTEDDREAGDIDDEYEDCATTTN